MPKYPALAGSYVAFLSSLGLAWQRIGSKSASRTKPVAENLRTETATEVSSASHSSANGILPVLSHVLSHSVIIRLAVRTLSSTFSHLAELIDISPVN